MGVPRVECVTECVMGCVVGCGGDDPTSSRRPSYAEVAAPVAVTVPVRQAGIGAAP
ncbi:hypothetical protein ACFPN0_20730 [Kitasatospora cinereorecta]